MLSLLIRKEKNTVCGDVIRLLFKLFGVVRTLGEYVRARPEQVCELTREFFAVLYRRAKAHAQASVSHRDIRHKLCCGYTAVGFLDHKTERVAAEVMFTRVYHGDAHHFNEVEIETIIASGQLPTDKWVMYRDVRGETYSLAPIRSGEWKSLKAYKAEELRHELYGEFNLVLTRGT
jgi:hypothetical protein